MKSAQRGYSLINMMLLLGSLALIGALQFRDQTINAQSQRAMNAGKHLKQLNSSVGDYLVAHATGLRKMQDNECAGLAGCVPTTSYCVTGLPYLNANQCELSYARLITEGFLPAGWVNLNAWGAQYATIVTRVPKPYVNLSAPGVLNDTDFNLRAITVTRSPWLDVSNGQPLLGFLGKSVEAGGNDLALTASSPSIANGLVRRQYDPSLTTGIQVTWQADASMNPFINSLGLLVARAGFEASSGNLNDELLRRDGANAMSGDLNLNDQRVNNVQDAFITAAGRNIAASMPTWVFKYSYRVNADGSYVPKPDCSAPSGGWSARGGLPLTNPWDATYAPNAASPSYDTGVARIMVNMDRLENQRSLGYNSSGSNPAQEPYQAEQNKARAFGAFQFNAVDAGAGWNVFIRYYQDVTDPANPNYNALPDPAYSQGLASVYCYYDRTAASACNGEAGCVNSGAGNPVGSAAASDLNQPPAVAPGDMAPYSPNSGSGAPWPGTPAGAGDVLQPLGG